MKNKNCNIICLFILILVIIQDLDAKVELISYRSWNYCYRISNTDCEIIINPAYGGQILYYGLNKLNINSLWTDSTLNGYSIERYYSSGRNRKAPDSGRFDIGNETLTNPIHDTLWVGPYMVRINNEYSLTLTSLPLMRAGIQISREYSLDNEGSHLHVRQSMKNISNIEVKYCHWSRTLLPTGGVYVTQYLKTPKYPNGYAQFGWNPEKVETKNPISDRLSFPNDSLFVVRPGGTTGVKFGIMSTSGWCFYVKNHLMFIKYFDIYPGGEYNNNPGFEFPNMIWFDNRFIELEPNSAMVKLKPGESNSHNENWWLFEYPNGTDNKSEVIEAVRFARINTVSK